MRILPDTFELIHQLQFINAAKGGGSEVQMLPFLKAQVDELPGEIDACVLTSDLQGVAPGWRYGGRNVLLGIQVAEELLDLAEAGTIPDPERMGVLLAGDLYSAPAGDKRGASGDVREVWTAFATMNRWVSGVAGNHDRFGTAREEARLRSHENLDLLLYGEVAYRDGLLIGGVSHIIGNPQKPGRRDQDSFLAALELALEASPNIVVLHEGPSGSTKKQRGNELLHNQFKEESVPLVVCGHVHWNDPLADLNGTQVINVDSRVVILTR
jgi:DNA repair exonuclease SbcCD nuclease subunit